MKCKRDLAADGGTIGQTRWSNPPTPPDDEPVHMRRTRRIGRRCNKDQLATDQQILHNREPEVQPYGYINTEEPALTLRQVIGRREAEKVMRDTEA